ncbi:hypothetical protein EON65_38395 [archaeon]|nr:MAG: hypothetical protein EON65_38395 [archaeon]
MLIDFMLLLILILAASSEDTEGGKNAQIFGILLIIMALCNHFVLHYAIVRHKALGVVMLVSLAIHGIREAYNTSVVALALLVGCNLLTYIIMSRLDFRLLYYPRVDQSLSSKLPAIGAGTICMHFYIRSMVCGLAVMMD